MFHGWACYSFARIKYIIVKTLAVPVLHATTPINKISKSTFWTLKIVPCNFELVQLVTRNEAASIRIE